MATSSFMARSARFALVLLCGAGMAWPVTAQWARGPAAPPDAAPVADQPLDAAFQRRLLEHLRQPARVHYALRSGIPPQVEGVTPAQLKPAGEARIEAIAPTLDERELDALSDRLLDSPRVREVIHNPRRAQRLAGALLEPGKPESGEEPRAPDTVRLRYFAYDIGRTVTVTASRDGLLKEITVQAPDYHAALSRAEVRRAEALVRQAARAPAELARLPIARGLAPPPPQNGRRLAHLLFRRDDDLRWRYEALVDLSNEKVLEARPLR
jgi:hypothetical protein